MTIEEAIKKLKEQQNKFNEHYIDYAGINETYNMAIKSLEAWEKVKDEIKQKSDFTKNIWDEYPDEWYAGKCSAYNESLEIIDKYLSEVSE